MDLNSVFDRKNDDFSKNEFIKELKDVLKNIINKRHNEENNVMEEYNRYERRKVFLDNRSCQGNNLAWIMDEKSVWISENGDGGPYAISDIELPENVKIGEVYEKINGKYVYNPSITAKLKEIIWIVMLCTII